MAVTELEVINETVPERIHIEMPRRAFLLKLGFLLNGIAATMVAVPVVGYLLSAFRSDGGYTSWIALGSLAAFPENQTRLAEFRILTRANGMARLPRFLVGCGGCKATSFKSSPSTARIWVVRCVGFRNRTCSCVRVTAELFTKMVRMLRGHRHADSMNTNTRSRTASYGYTADNFRH